MVSALCPFSVLGEGTREQNRTFGGTSKVHSAIKRVSKVPLARSLCVTLQGAGSEGARQALGPGGWLADPAAPAFDARTFVIGRRWSWPSAPAQGEAGAASFEVPLSPGRLPCGRRAPQVAQGAPTEGPGALGRPGGCRWLALCRGVGRAWVLPWRLTRAGGSLVSGGPRSLTTGGAVAAQMSSRWPRALLTTTLRDRPHCLSLPGPGSVCGRPRPQLGPPPAWVWRGFRRNAHRGRHTGQQPRRRRHVAGVEAWWGAGARQPSALLSHSWTWGEPCGARAPRCAGSLQAAQPGPGGPLWRLLCRARARPPGVHIVPFSPCVPPGSPRPAGEETPVDARLGVCSAHTWPRA